jgi:hypothetical protein
MENRRTFLRTVLGVGAGALASGRAAAQHSDPTAMPRFEKHPAQAQPTAGRASVLVQTPDVADLPFKMEGKVKAFQLVAEPVKQQILPGRVLDLWGFNGSAPGPTIQVNQGDRVRVTVDNHLPEDFSMHWHGFEIPFAMDGGPGASQKPIPPGGRFVYEFTLHQEGTYFYHSHMAMQEMMGLLGAFIMHPANAYHPPVDHDFAILLQEYAVLPANSVPNSMSMEFNWLTFNGKTGPAVTPLLVRLGSRVRIRLINLGMDHHPIHLHGNTFSVTGTEAGRQPESTWGTGNTVLVGVAQARDIEFEANNPGDWMLHCHLPHHMMNQMSSMVGPLSRRPGMPAGLGMEEGAGIIRQREALSGENGPSLGRGLGVGSSNEQRISNGPQSRPAAMASMQGMQGMQGVQKNEEELPANANQVPGFPQDAFMESPMMAMDAMVAKPENYGLPAGWSGYMQGMMTFVRVLPAEMYDRIMTMKKQSAPDKPQAMPGMEHQHHDS